MLHGFLFLEIEVRADFTSTYFGEIEVRADFTSTPLGNFEVRNYFTSTLLRATRWPLLTTS